MFKSLFDLGYKRDWKGAIGFYLSYLLLVVLLGALWGGIGSLLTGSSSFGSGYNAGNLLAIVFCIVIAYITLKSKNLLNSFGLVILGLISGLGAYFGGGLLGLIPVAYLTTRGPANKIKESQKDQKVMKNYASFKIRLGAYFIDFIGITILEVFLFWVLPFIGIHINLTSDTSIWWNFLFYIIADVTYNTFFLSIWSSTPGKKIYGLVVLTEDHKQLDFGLALKRSLWRILSLLVFGSGYWNMNKNEKRQAQHDIKMKMVVLAEKKRNYTLPIILSLLGIALWFYLRKASA